MDTKIHEDNYPHFNFTRPQRIDTAVHTLEGFLKGIAIDGQIESDEVKTLQSWCLENKDLLDHPPFDELLPLIEEATFDGQVSEEEKEDLLWFCKKFYTTDSYYNAISADIQRLHGILGGIVSDNIITKDELEGLSAWLSEHEHLRSYWPFDEIDSLVTSVLEDGIIDAQEHEMLLNFFSEFFTLSDKTGTGGSKALKSKTITGVCAMAPEIEFQERIFCFTGTSKRAARKKIKETVTNLGGLVSDGLTQSVDYLVIGASGNPCWAFACYGRKVEKAVNMRKKGSNLLIVHENDFWDAVEDCQLE